MRRELQRRAEELLAERAAVARVVAGAAVGRLVAEGFVGLAVVREARGDDRAVADDVGAGELLLHDEAERVALLQREEIDVPLEDVDELLHELRRFRRRRAALRRATSRSRRRPSSRSRAAAPGAA